MNVTFNEDYGDSDLVVLNNTCRKSYQDIFAIYQSTKLQLTAKIDELNNTILKLKQSKRCQICTRCDTSQTITSVRVTPQTITPVPTHQTSTPVPTHQTSTPVPTHQTSTPAPTHQTSTPALTPQTTTSVLVTPQTSTPKERKSTTEQDKQLEDVFVVPESCLSDWSESDDFMILTQQKSQENAAKSATHTDDTVKLKRKPLSISRKLTFNKQKRPAGKPPLINVESANTVPASVRESNSTAANEKAPYSSDIVSGQPITTQKNKYPCYPSIQDNADDSADIDKENAGSQISQVFVTQTPKALKRNIVDNKASVESASAEKLVASLFDLSSSSDNKDFQVTKSVKSPTNQNVRTSALAGTTPGSSCTSKKPKLRQTVIDVTRLVPPVKLHNLDEGPPKSGDSCKLNWDTQPNVESGKKKRKKDKRKKDKKKNKKIRKSENGSPMK